MKTLVIKNQHWARYLGEWINKRANGDENMMVNPDEVRCVAHVIDRGPDVPANEDDILGVAAFWQWKRHSVEATIISGGQKVAKASRELLWETFNLVFNEWDKQVIEAFVETTNHKSIAVTENFGFKRLCEIPDYCGPGKNAYYYVLTKNDWLNGKWATKEPLNPENARNLKNKSPCRGKKALLQGFPPLERLLRDREYHETDCPVPRLVSPPCGGEVRPAPRQLRRWGDSAEGVRRAAGTDRAVGRLHRRWSPRGQGRPLDPGLGPAAAVRHRLRVCRLQRCGAAGGGPDPEAADWAGSVEGCSAGVAVDAVAL